MEAAVANFTEPGTKLALLTNGFFADRIGEMARRHGAKVTRLAKSWGEPFDAQEAREFIRRERPQVVAAWCRRRPLPACTTRPSRCAKPRTRWMRW